MRIDDIFAEDETASLFSVGKHRSQVYEVERPAGNFRFAVLSTIMRLMSHGDRQPIVALLRDGRKLL